jgi:hypothetical protein
VLYYNIDALKGPAGTFLKKIGSPLLVLWLAFWFNTYEIIYMSLIKFNLTLIMEFTFMILLIKAIPIYLLYRRGLSINWTNDTIVTSIVILMYIIYLRVNNQDPSKIYEETEKSLIQGDNKTPMFYLIEKLRKLVQ